MMHRQYRPLSDTFLITLLLITSRSRKIYRSKHDKYNISLSLVINREIFIPNREIGRFSLFYQKSGDLPQNRETWKLWNIFIYNNLFQCYARLKVIDSENENAEKQCSKISLKSKLTPRLPPLIIIK